MTHGRASAALVTMLLVAGCDAPQPAPPRPAARPGTSKTAPRRYPFRLVGPRPWNETVYVAVGAAVDSGEPYAGAILDESGAFTVSGAPGAPYHVRSEENPTAPERLVLWMVDARGTLGDGDAETVVQAPPRAPIVLVTPPGSAGPDAVTLFHEKTGTCVTAYRDPRLAYFLAIWDGDVGRAYRNIAPPRPWSIEDLAPGEYIVGAQTEGHHWTARRATLQPGTPLEIDAGKLPRGGGSIVCDDAGALLLLAGELPIPAPRITTSLHYRSTWNGVPPGKHRMRYPDGREVEVEVREGEKTRLGR